MSESKDDIKVVDKVSPAQKYEAILLEKAGKGLTEERILLVFRIFDQILPELGVFSTVVKKIRNELFDAVYSDQYTGKNEEGQFIQHIPYFTLVRRVHRQRDETSEELKQQLETVKERLFEKQKQYEDSIEKTEELQENITNLQATVSDLKNTMKESQRKIDSLEITLTEEREASSKMESNLNCDINDLKEELTVSNAEIAFLQQYKKGYDNMQRAFSKTSDPDADNNNSTNPHVATKRSHLVSDIDSAMKLEDQLLSVQNATIEEFDKFMELHKIELLNKNIHDGLTSEEYDEELLEIDQADQDLLLAEDRFLKGMKAISLELQLLRQHKVMLQEQLQKLEEHGPSNNGANQGTGRESRGVPQKDGVDTIGPIKGPTVTLDLDMTPRNTDDPSADPFIVQERVFSKYAAMLYTSENGRAFHEFKNAKYCKSCGEKTVLCPHKILQHEHVFMLPKYTTHLKIIRPRVKINLEVMDNIFQSAYSGESRDGVIMTSRGSKMSKAFHSRMSVLRMSSPTDSSSPGEGEERRPGAGGRRTPLDVTPPSRETSGTLGQEDHHKNTTQRMWEDFKMRTNFERTVPRVLELRRTLSLTEQFAAHILWKEELDPDEVKVHSFVDEVYTFFLERYNKEEGVMHMVVHDFLSSLVEYGSSNKIVQLFTHIMIGNYDGSVLRYFLLICDFIDMFHWTGVKDFRRFSAIIYPFLNEDDLETLHMGYTSFSENTISKTKVAEYFIYIIMKYREPSFLEMEERLSNTPGKEASSMTEAEFSESVEAAVSVPSDSLRRRLYREALADVSAHDNTQSVPNLRLAQITSYLNLMQLQPLIAEEILQKVEPVRSKSAGSVDQGFLASPERLITMSSAKTLASNIARRNKCREESTGAAD